MRPGPSSPRARGCRPSTSTHAGTRAPAHADAASQPSWVLEGLGCPLLLPSGLGCPAPAVPPRSCTTSVKSLRLGLPSAGELVSLCSRPWGAWAGPGRAGKQQEAMSARGARRRLAWQGGAESPPVGQGGWGVPCGGEVGDVAVKLLVSGAQAPDDSTGWTPQGRARACGLEDPCLCHRSLFGLGHVLLLPCALAACGPVTVVQPGLSGRMKTFKRPQGHVFKDQGSS